jgi:hypothetical protein
MLESKLKELQANFQGSDAWSNHAGARHVPVVQTLIVLPVCSLQPPNRTFSFPDRKILLRMLPVADGKLVTGQNPASSEKTAQLTLEALAA